MGALNVDTSDYKAFAVKLKGAERTVKNSLRKRLRDAGKPLAEAVAEDGPEGLPSSGGLADWLRSSAKPSLSMTATRLAVKLTGGTGSRTGRTSDLGAINRGRLRHPVYARPGRRAGWANQGVTAGTYDKAIEKHADEALPEIEKVLDDVMRELA